MRSTLYGFRQLVHVFFLTFLFVCAALPAAEGEGLTFFGWSDQHVGVDGNASHLVPAIEAMNELPGTQYPEAIGGTVDRPAFVLGCGDITEWPTTAAKNAYDALITGRMKYPSYDMMGNHDTGGKMPSDTMKRWIIARHGGVSYTFDSGGVRFIVLFSKYDENLDSPAQPIAKDALNDLRNKLAKVPEPAPVVVATHLCYDAVTNKPELTEAFGNANVILVLGGHYHKAKVDRFGGFHFVQLPSPAPGSPSEVTVVRITQKRLVAIPYDYEAGKWDENPRKALDVAIEGPARPAAESGPGNGPD
ncbi:MAG: metallophosphoesterase family protein [Planctomycetota bacterium]|jgi:hypothetical protein